MTSGADRKLRHIWKYIWLNRFADGQKQDQGMMDALEIIQRIQQENRQQVLNRCANSDTIRE